MSPRDLAVIFLGLTAGYWLVSKLQDWFASRGREAGSGNVRREIPPVTPPSGPAPTPPREDAPWFEVLGVPESAGLDDIAGAYKRRISEYHPDKVAGMASEIRELAERRSKQINTAYDAAVKQRRSHAS